MRIFIRTGENGFPETETDYTAWQGFLALGFRPVFYDNEGELACCRPDDLIVGGVSTINRRLKAYGIHVDEYDYPAELEEFLGRRIWTDTLESVLRNEDQWPVFVKPVKDKVFVGFMLESGKSIPRLRHARPDELVLCSEVVHFEAEWRVFIRYGNIIDVRPYRGDWRSHYDPGILETAVEKYKSAPAGYAMDIGVTEEGQTLLVEINDGFALETYGINPVQYAKLLSARWSELTGIHDECDVYLEAVDWKKNKKVL